MKNFVVSEQIKKEILTTLVEPQYKNEIKGYIALRKKFKNMGLLFETMSKFFVGVSSIMSFASGIYKYEIMSFLAGTTSVVSLVLLQYSSFSYRESKKMTSELNDILKKLDITTLNIENLSTTDSLDNIQIDQPNTPLSPEK
jgi:membrane protein DedA with SNARE-associated domain